MRNFIIPLLLILSLFMAQDLSAARSVTIPFTEDFDSNNYSDLLWLTNGASHSYLSSGGWSGGAASFSPPSSTSGGNGTYSGLGSFNFSSQSETHVRFLVKFGPTYIQTSRSGVGNQQNKFGILTPDSSGQRGILSLHPTDTGDFSFGVCNNSVCKYEAGEGSAPGSGLFYPPGNDAFLLSEYLDEWIAMEYVTNLGTGITSVYIWTQDGVHNGLYKQYDINQGGGTNSLQILGGYYNGYHQSDANNYVMFDELEINSSYIGPPSGFIGGSSAVCGDGSCSSGETCSSCAQDCGVCPTTIDLSSGFWETTFNCSAWNSYNEPLNCDGVNRNSSDTVSPEGYYEQITSSANYPGGGGANGQRHWSGDGTDNQSGGLRYVFETPQSEFWMRWYQRWESGYNSSWSRFQNVWFEGDDATRHVFRPSGDSLGIYTSPGVYNYPNMGYGSDFYDDGVSDGNWQYFEVHLDIENNVWETWVNGERKFIEDNVDFGDTETITYFQMPVSNENVSNGESMYIDIDDIRISTTGYIGPVTGGQSVCGDGVCASGESCSNCSQDCGTCQVNPVCGNGQIESGEACDDGNTQTETCSYGQSSCNVCSSVCQSVSGQTSYCGDARCDTANENSSTCAEDCSASSGGSIFFEEDFESYNNDTFNSSWYGSVNGYSDFDISSEESASEGNSLKKTYESGVEQTGFVTQHFGDSTKSPVLEAGRGDSYQDIYVQYKIYYSPGFDFSAGNNKQIIFGTDDGSSHTEQCCNPWVAHYTTIASRDGYFSAELNNKQSSGNWYGLDPNLGAYNTSNRYSIETGRWYTVEARKRLNDSGQDNGIFEMWVDGLKVSEHTGLRFRVPDTGTYGTDFSYGSNFLLLSTYINNPSPQDQAVYFDDVIMSTEYIGVGTSQSYCGDGSCDVSEDCNTCSQDCGTCQVDPICGNAVVESGEICDDGNTINEACAYGQNSCNICNSNCQLVAGETSYCGDNSCQSNESCETCVSDCGQCPVDNVLPTGSFDNADQGYLRGWAYDGDMGDEPISVHVYMDGDYHGQTLANLRRDDLVSVVGSANHGFVYDLGDLSPGNYQFHIYAINQPSGDNPELPGCPKNITINAPDTTPPSGSVEINNGAASTETQSVVLTINGSDSSGISNMKVSNNADFDAASLERYSRTKYWNLSTSEGNKTVYVWLQDGAGNWSSLLQDSIELVSIYAQISEINVDSIEQNTAQISWQASGANYCELYYGINSDTSQVQVADSNSSSYQINLSALSDSSTYSYYVSCENEYSNVSLSPVYTFRTEEATQTDQVFPSLITDLQAEADSPNSVSLYWTSTGDDLDEGVASEYDIRYSTRQINVSNWDTATQLHHEPAPLEPYSGQSYTVVGLESGTRYYFAIRVADEIPNWSGISNVVGIRTEAEEVKDKIPPGHAKEFKSYPANKQVVLTWQNPDDYDFAKVAVLMSEEPYAYDSNHLLALGDSSKFRTAGVTSKNPSHVVVYEGSAEAYVVTGLENYKRYYFAIVSMDGVPNYSETMYTEARPEESKEVIEKSKEEIKQLKKDYRHLARVQRRLVESITKDEAKLVYSHGQFVDMSDDNVYLYQKLMARETKKMSNRQKYALAYFIEHGTPTTERLGSGERAGVLNSFFDVYARLPRSKSDYQDIIKIANGRWPGKKSNTKLNEARDQFVDVYKRSDETDSSEFDNAAITIMTYGLRPAERNLESERAAITTFESIWGRGPSSASEWDIVRAIAYSGASR